MDGIAGYLRKATDMHLDRQIEELRGKSVVLYPGIDFSGFDSVARTSDYNAPVIVWNHRWEHDKNPETFFETMMQLSADGINFKLIILGQHFIHGPEIFARSRKVLKKHIIHFGYAAEKKEYIRLLHQADIVVSTSIHEFFGMAVLEAVRCGCRPVVPDRLSYCELFPRKFRYLEGDFYRSIASVTDNYQRMGKHDCLELAGPYAWQNMARKYEKWLVSYFVKNI